MLSLVFSVINEIIFAGVFCEIYPKRAEVIKTNTILWNSDMHTYSLLVTEDMLVQTSSFVYHTKHRYTIERLEIVASVYSIFYRCTMLKNTEICQ